MYINHYIFLINFALVATYKQAAKKKLYYIYKYQ